jgi:hypothetical protein
LAPLTTKKAPYISWHIVYIKGTMHNQARSLCQLLEASWGSYFGVQISGTPLN